MPRVGFLVHGVEVLVLVDPNFGLESYEILKYRRSRELLGLLHLCPVCICSLLLDVLCMVLALLAIVRIEPESEMMLSQILEVLFVQICGRNRLLVKVSFVEGLVVVVLATSSVDNVGPSEHVRVNGVLAIDGPLFVVLLVIRFLSG